MQVISSVEVLREQLAEWRRAGDHVALVPTMGNLHEGHLSLVQVARQHAERVIVSIFVNPTQFGADEDLDRYPRTLERDKRLLKRAKADLIFTPDIDTMYPFGIENATSVMVPVLSEELCGAFRPGHFDGVATVVSRLFGLVQPDAAVFGQKDYQQQLVIRRMVADLSMPTEIFTAPTIREDDGLAKSSRNQYLTDDERLVAPCLHASLSRIAEQLESKNLAFASLESEAMKRLEEAGFRPEYVSIRDAADLGEATPSADEFVVLAAAWLGEARLIDNVLVRPAAAAPSSG